MEEPLLWNPLPEAARYLSKVLSRSVDERALIDLVLKKGGFAVDTPTIVLTLLPRDRRYAAVTRLPSDYHQETGSLRQARQPFRSALEAEFGPLPMGLAYLREFYHPKAAPLFQHQLIDLMLYGEAEIGLLNNVATAMPNEQVWLMPFGASHKFALGDCGLKREELRDFAKRILLESESENTASTIKSEAPQVPPIAPEDEIADEKDSEAVNKPDASMPAITVRPKNKWGESALRQLLAEYNEPGMTQDKLAEVYKCSRQFIGTKLKAAKNINSPKKAGWVTSLKSAKNN